MALKINYLKTENKQPSNIVLFSDEKFKISSLERYIDKNEISYISDLLKTSDLKKNLLVFELNSKKKIVLVSVKDKLKSSDIEGLGAEFYTRINLGKNSEYSVISDSLKSKHENFLSYFLHGIKLKSYSFNKYKTKKEDRKILINVIGKKNIPSAQLKLKFKALEEGTFYARDLVSEPGNILHPDEYAKRINSLKRRFKSYYL